MSRFLIGKGQNMWDSEVFELMGKQGGVKRWVGVMENGNGLYGQLTGRSFLRFKMNIKEFRRIIFDSVLICCNMKALLKNFKEVTSNNHHMRKRFKIQKTIFQT